jgi:HNH endonuclease
MDQSLRDQVWRRANAVCEYCHLPQQFDVLPFQVDHIIASKHHGPTTADNLALSCFDCNIHKGPNIAGIDPLTGEITPLFHPRRDHWNEHFEWDGAVLIGRTRIGRATVDVLQINLHDRQEQRRLLLEAGLLST